MKLIVKSTFVFIFIFLLISKKSKAQDEVLFISGDYSTVKVLDTMDYKKIIVNRTKKNGNIKKQTLFKEDIYSIRYDGSKEVVIYKQDTLEGEYFTPQEMRIYIQGEQDAAKGFKPVGCAIGAGVAGLTGGLFLGFFSPLLPAAYTVVAGSRLFWIKIKRKNVSNEAYLEEEVYKLGYEKEARNKRIQQSLIWGGVGVVLGAVGSYNINYFLDK